MKLSNTQTQTHRHRHTDTDTQTHKCVANDDGAAQLVAQLGYNGQPLLTHTAWQCSLSLTAKAYAWLSSGTSPNEIIAELKPASNAAGVCAGGAPGVGAGAGSGVGWGGASAAAAGASWAGGSSAS